MEEGCKTKNNEQDEKKRRPRYDSSGKGMKRTSKVARGLAKRAIKGRSPAVAQHAKSTEFAQHAKETIVIACELLLGEREREPSFIIPPIIIAI